MTPHRIASLADIERIEARPYAEFMAHTSVHAALADAAQRHPDRTALTYIESADDLGGARRWTYRAFIADVRRAANLFQALAGEAEPRVAILLPAIPQACFALWGAEAVGVACPMNYLLDATHLADLVQASGANILVALGPHPELDIWSRVPGLRAQCPGLAHVLSVGAGSDGDAIDFDLAMARHAAAAPMRPTPLGPESIAALFHTGGTTGAPKLAQHRHGNQLHSAWSAAQMYAMDERDVIINAFPMFHVAGTLVYGLSSLLSGAEIVMPTLLGLRNPRFVARYWEAVAHHRVTLLAAVPTVMSTLLAVDPAGADLSRVRAVYTGGSPLPPEIAQAFEDRYAIPVRNILGMTECAGVVSIEPALAPRAPGSCGLRLPYTQVEAVRQGLDGGPACGPDEPGVLRLRGPNVGPGYTDASRNAGTLSSDGWLSTGDIGHLDAQGRIFVTGRAKDVIIRSGHNIEPGSIESALMRHPDVQFAAAVGEPDEYAGELPVAFVVLNDGSTVTPAELLAFVAPHIPERPAWPKRVDILENLPVTAIGKVYKPALRLRAVERALVERLDRAGLAGRVLVTGRDTPAGLRIELAPAPGSGLAERPAAIEAIMAKFAITWSWTTR